MPQLKPPGWLDFGPLTDALGKLRGSREDLRNRLEKKKQLREDLARSPASPNDMVKAYDEVIDRLGQEYQERLVMEVSRFSSHPLHIDELAGDSHPLGKTAPLSLGWRNAKYPDRVDPGALAFFVPDLLKNGMHRAIEQTPNLGEVKLDLGARRAEIEKLDSEIADMGRQLAQLEKTAADAGIRFRRT